MSSVIISSKFCFTESEAFLTPTALISRISSFSETESFNAVIWTVASNWSGWIIIDLEEISKSRVSASPSKTRGTSTVLEVGLLRVATKSTLLNLSCSLTYSFSNFKLTSGASSLSSITRLTEEEVLRPKSVVSTSKVKVSIPS